jgi:hypothetical protein
LIEPEDDSCGDADGGHEGMRAAIITRLDAPPILEPSEHVFNCVALLIESCVVLNRRFRVGF